MNKTVTINLGGIVFHIDEDAFAKLSKYIDSIKHSLSNSFSKDEVIRDIELRISEIFTEKLKNNRQIIGIIDVEEMIAIMGQPEDYNIDDDSKDSENYNSYIRNRMKKLYRDKDNSVLGGVAAGLGHYFGIDKVWIRALFLLLTFIFGTSVFLYLILWIIIPKARTSFEKMEMTGEPVNISSIERKVREDFEYVSEKIKNVDYDKYGSKLKNGSYKFIGVFSEILKNLFEIVGKAIGIVLFSVSAIVLICLLIVLIFFATSLIVFIPWHQELFAFVSIGFPIWLLAVLVFFAIGIPFFFIALLGLKIISPNMKYPGNIAKYILLAIFIISVLVLIVIGIKQAVEHSSNASFTTETNIVINHKDSQEKYKS